MHGSDGLGNTYPPPPKTKAIDTFAPDFLIEKVNQYPGEVTIVALGPLTNLAKVCCTFLFVSFTIHMIISLSRSWRPKANSLPHSLKPHEYET